MTETTIQVPKSLRDSVMGTARRWDLVSLTELVVALPATTVEPGRPHHVRLAGRRLGRPKPTRALTEHPRTISRDRLTRTADHVGTGCMTDNDQWPQDSVGVH